MPSGDSSGRRRPDVIVIGAGLSGLACASDLIRSGKSVRVLESSDGVGGRMRTDRKDGFLLDRGFQVFNTSYPQVKRRLPLRALRLRPFTPGALVHTGHGRFRLTDPTRHPGGAGDMLPGRLAGGRDLAAFALMSVRDMTWPAGRLKSRPDRTTLTALSEAGISHELIETFFRPFLSGVFLEDELETSSRFFHLVWRSMLRGSLCLPAGGIGAVPALMADQLPPGTVRLETPVRTITGSGVLLDDGTEVPAATVVVAAGAEAAARLMPELTVPPTRTVTTYYHAAAAAPLTEPTILVDSRRRFLNTCVLSEVSPRYAADGRALVSTSQLGGERAGSHAALLAALADAYGTDTGAWERIATRTVDGALPAMPPPWPLSRTTRVGPGRYACGDHRASGSVQGALASGARAAREVLADA